MRTEIHVTPCIVHSTARAKTWTLHFLAVYVAVPYSSLCKITETVHLAFVSFLKEVTRGCEVSAVVGKYLTLCLLWALHKYAIV